MANLLATSLLKQQDFPDSFRFYFKKPSHVVQHEQSELQDLVRPRLKIAIVTETWPPEINGVALSLLHLCQGLQKQGHKILLIRPKQKQVCADFVPYKECFVTAQGIPKYPNLNFGWPQYRKISQSMDDFAPDVVHIVTEGPLGLTALQVAKSKNIPVSSGFHSPFQDFSRFFDLAFLVKPVQQYLKWFHNSTELTCVPSQDTAQALRSFGIRCPLTVVGRGVDTDLFNAKHRSEKLRQQWGAGSDSTVLLYVGRLSPEKEIDILIQAYQALTRMRQKTVHLVIVGDGPERERLKRLDASKQVIFTGNLSGQSLSAVYASADAFVFASQVETFGNVVLEAMASGLPVLAYDYACAHQHIRPAETGWLIPLGQQLSFIQMIYQLPEPKLLKKMGQQAAKQVQQVGWQYPVQQFEQALYDVKQRKMTAT